MMRRDAHLAWTVRAAAISIVSLLVLSSFGCGGQAQNSSGNGRNAEGTVVTETAAEQPAAHEAAPGAQTPSVPAKTEAAKKPVFPWAGEANLPELPPVSKRIPLPELAMRDMSGRDITREDYRGKVVLLNFWATWCGPCRMEIPTLVKLHDGYAAYGLRIIAPSIDRNGLAAVKPFLDKNPQIKYPVVPNGIPAAQAFGGIQSIPTSFLIDRQGRVVTRFMGLVQEQVLEGYVKAALLES